MWHGGFSGSAPLKVSSEAEVREIFDGLDVDFATIPFDQTVLSGMNLVITGGAIVVALVMCALLVPKRDQGELTSFASVDVPASPIRPPVQSRTLPEKLESSPVLCWALALPILIWWLDYAWIGDAMTLPWFGDTNRLVPETRSWKQLSPNEVNLLFLALGLILHGSPRNYVRAVNDAVRGCSGIILQFPLYAGIMGMMKYTNLTALLAEGIAGISSATTLPLFTFISAGVVNLFVPSGGGQWAVQGPIAMQAAQQLDVNYAKMVMAVAYGDQLTNMLQPFWALPLIAITGVRARDLVGYTCLIMLAVALWIGLALLLF